MGISYIEAAKGLPKTFRPRFAVNQDLRATLGISGCPQLLTINDVDTILGEIVNLQQRVLVAAALDRKCRMVHCSIVSLDLSATQSFRIADVFYGAIHSSAAAILLAHNQPGEYSDPTPEEVQLVEDIAEAGFLLGYPLVDHIIFAKDGLCSVLSVEFLRLTSKNFAEALVRRGKHRSKFHVEWKCPHCKTTNTDSWQELSEAVLVGQLALPTKCALCCKFTWLGVSEVA